MRILFVTNFYPPHHVGGYEIGCRDVAEELVRRGHEVSVLTSTFGVGGARSEGAVHRRLPIDLGPPARSAAVHAASLVAAEGRARVALRRLVARARPDVVWLWNLRWLPLSIARDARRLGLPIAWFVSDDWLAHAETVDRWEQWCADAPRSPLRGAVKRTFRTVVERAGLAGGGELDLRHVQFASEFLKRDCLAAGKPVGEARVVPWGIDVDAFAFRASGPAEPLRLLYAGQLTPAKGVHTAIEALALLADAPALSLTIAGAAADPAYEARLRSLVESAGLGPRVRFAGRVDRERMRALYHEHDLLVFSSIWEEPLSLVLLEAMASGLAVVGTATGGSAEVLRDGGNALVFAAGDAGACAARIRTLVRDIELYERVRREARRTIERAHEIGGMVDALEAALAAAGSPLLP